MIVNLAKIRSLMGANLEKPQDLANVLNMTRENLYLRFKDENKWRLKELNVVAEHYNVSIHDLLY